MAEPTSPLAGAIAFSAWGVVASLAVPAGIVLAMWFASGWMHSVMTVDQWFYSLKHPRCAPPAAVYKIAMTATILIDGLAFYCVYAWIELGSPRFLAAVSLLAIQTATSLLAAVGFFAFHSFLMALLGYTLALPAALGAGIACLTEGDYWTNVAGGFLMAMAGYTTYFTAIAGFYALMNRGGYRRAETSGQAML